MNKPEILETIRQWADGHRNTEINQIEITERPAPPPLVDRRAGLTPAPEDISGISGLTEASNGRQLQIWISSDNNGNSYCITNEDSDEIETWELPAFDTPSQLEKILNDLADEFLETQ